jgi:hypothetical protein
MEDLFYKLFGFILLIGMVIGAVIVGLSWLIAWLAF